MKNWSTTQIVLTLLGVFAVGSIIGYFIPPVNTWFGKPDKKPLSDCKTADGIDGKKDAQGNCIALPSERRGTTRQEPILDANGRNTGGYIPIVSDGTAKKRACEKVTYGGYTGWVGDCKFPIGSGA